MNDDPKPLGDEEVNRWTRMLATLVGDWDFAKEDAARLIATIRDRDARIAHLEHELSERKLGDHYAGYMAAQADTRRAEAFALFVPMAMEARHIVAYPSIAEEAIITAAKFNAEWEKRHE